MPEFVAPVESRSGEVSAAYPLEFLPRKADNYMNSTFANQAVHQRMEAGTGGRCWRCMLRTPPSRGVARLRRCCRGCINARGRMVLKAKVSGSEGPGKVGPGRGGGSAGLGEAACGDLSGAGRECKCADQRAGNGYRRRGYVLLDAGGGAESERREHGQDGSASDQDGLKDSVGAVEEVSQGVSCRVCG